MGSKARLARLALRDWSLGGLQKVRFRCWERRRCDPDSLRRPGGPAVILLPGVWEDWGALLTWGRHLFEAGFDVNFFPEVDRMFGPLEALARQVAEGAAQRGLGPALIVAHSKGGLVGKACLIEFPGRFTGLITCGTPFAGAPLARLLPQWSQMADLNPENPKITTLANDLPTNRKLVQVEAKWDQNVPRVGMLPGAIHVTSNIVGHNALLEDKETAKTIARMALHISENWR